ncbi:hypothetical protein BCR33DRAFT_728725, partial [Rhizoclosmatium globosum]
MLILPSTILCSIATGVSLFLVFYLIYFIIINEFVLVSKGFSWKAFASLFNILIITGNLASVGFSISVAVQRFYAEADSPLQKGMGIIAGFTIALSEYCYLRCTWARGSDIVRRSFKPLFSGMSLLLMWVPILLIAECTVSAVYILKPKSAQVASIFFGIYGVTGFVVVVFDAVMLISFIQCLRSTHTEEEAVSEDFLIISWYGIGSSLLCFSVNVVFVGAGL